MGSVRRVNVECVGTRGSYSLSRSFTLLHIPPQVVSGSWVREYESVKVCESVWESEKESGRDGEWRGDELRLGGQTLSSGVLTV